MKFRCPYINKYVEHEIIRKEVGKTGIYRKIGFKCHGTNKCDLLEKDCEYCKKYENKGM